MGFRALLLAPTLLLAACGGGEDGGDSSDEDAIRQVVEVSTRTPVKVCDNLAPATLEAIGGKAVCQKLAKGQKGRDADITSVSITGDTAAVRVGEKAGESTANLQKIDGTWKLVTPDRERSSSGR